ncbi:MFS transporter, partial [Jatrophihabitans endophyticus]|uniref:bifunctional MFS transporter/dTMP kinase n=1 Tax=Jatrophihabitans endophyticus TaxID=1206085 RepID=UPI001A05F93D
MSEAGAPVAGGTDGRTRARRENSLLALFKIPVFRRVWAAIAFSSLGDWLGLLANTALAQQLTKSHSVAAQGAAISGVILVRLAPDLLFGAFAAAIADKLDRRRLAIIGDVTAGVLYASIAISYHLLWLYIAQFVIEAAGLFTSPAKQVIWVSIVPKKLLATANQISLLSVYGSVPVAAALFALLSAGNRLIGGPTHGTNWAIVIALLLDTVTFFVSATTIFVSRRQIPAVPSEREQGESIFRLLREGVTFVRRDPLIRALYVGIIGAFAGGGLTVGVAQLWVATLDAGNAGYSIMFGTLFTGLAVGMLAGPRVLPTLTRSRVFGLAIGGAGITLLVMSLLRDFILADILAALVGMFAGMAWIVGYTLIGAEVEDRLRGRIFAFVLSSVRLTLLLTIAVGPVLAGALGTHSFRVGDQSRFSFSGPGLTLLIGGVLALLVSFYATSRAGRPTSRLRDLVRHRVVNTGLAPRHPAHAGIFITVDGTDADATAGYAALIVADLRTRKLVVTETAEPTDSPTGRRVEELLLAAEDGDAVEPETAALLSAADRTEHVTSFIRPALQRGEIVVCDRF